MSDKDNVIKASETPVNEVTGQKEGFSIDNKLYVGMKKS